MEFPFGQTVHRDRRKQITDPYDATKTVPGTWDDVETVPILNAFVASSSSAGGRDATRTQVLTSKSLYCAPGADVEVGDRIRAAGVDYYVNAKPTADVNPFTGWQPVMEIPLDNTEG